ncbi:MAG: regulatory protein GemA [Firmicutes bacterium]|nr:regulatory protein GemA [Bacillota bacterium]
MKPAAGKIEKWQIQRIHIYGSQLGLVDRSVRAEGNMDELHLLIHSMTGRCSTKELNDMEANRVLNRLEDMMKAQGLTIGKKQDGKAKNTSKVRRTGMITPEQEKAVWFHMYRLAELDTEPSKASLPYRLCRIIEKELKVTAFEKDIFRFISQNQAGVLIEKIKKYVQSAKRKTKQKEDEKLQTLLWEASSLQEKMLEADGVQWSELKERLEQVERELDVLRIHMGVIGGNDGG